MRMALAVVAAVVAPAAAPDVHSLVLRSAQVGNGYVQFPAVGGNGVAGDRTLNLCGVDNYPSESLRVSRLQVNYAARGKPIGVTNEVVGYKGGGALQAMREAARHAASCPKHPIDTGQNGLPKLEFRITRIKTAHLLKGYLAVRIEAIGTLNGRHVAQTSFAVYQQRGNVLSGVYSFGATTVGQLALCLHAARQSAQNLISGISSAPTA